MSAAVQLPGSFGPSSGGAESASFGPMKFGGEFRAKTILESQRYRELDRLESYFRCTNHDWKQHDFEGRAIAGPGAPTGMPFLSQEKSAWYVPLAYRRPSSPCRLAKLIVESFTSLLLGEEKWPSFEVPGDPDATDYFEALSEATELPARLIEARGLGGAMGTVGLSWCFVSGQPRVEVHNAKHLFVHEWRDRQQLVPAAVSEVYRYARDEWDERKQAFARNYYWHHRYWDEEKDVHFLPVLYDPKVEPAWVIDEAASHQHGDGLAHFVWVQNLPGQDPDGYSDYDGLLDNFDTIDVLSSVLARGATLNLDPTLVLSVPQFSETVRKGSDNALVVGKDGDAKYLELAGTSLQAGNELLDSKKKGALEVAQCVLADPNEVAAAGISSVALKVIYKPMLAKASVFRTQYGNAIKRVLLQMISVVRAHPNERLLLPPKVDLDGGTGEEKLTDRKPGNSSFLTLRWPPFFEATPDDKNKAVETLSKAAGGKSLLSAKTAVEQAAEVFGLDANEEWKRVEDAKAEELEAAAATFEDSSNAGGQVQVTQPLPDGASMVYTGSSGAPGKGGGAPPGGDQAGGGDAGGGFSPDGP